MERGRAAQHVEGERARREIVHQDAARHDAGVRIVRAEVAGAEAQIEKEKRAEQDAEKRQGPEVGAEYLAERRNTGQAAQRPCFER